MREPVSFSATFLSRKLPGTHFYRTWTVWQGDQTTLLEDHHSDLLAVTTAEKPTYQHVNQETTD